MSAKEAKTNNRSESVYWIGRHKRSFLGGLAVLGIAATAGLSWVDINRNQDTAEQGQAALKRDQACLSIIEDKTPPGKNVATISLASLSPQQKYNCRLNKLPSRVNVGEGYGEPSLIVKVTNQTTVELPSATSVKAAIAQDTADAHLSKYDGIVPGDVLIGGLGLPAMTFMLTAVLSGDYKTLNSASGARRPQQTNISA